jgi:hypothetical protein
MVKKPFSAIPIVLLPLSFIAFPFVFVELASANPVWLNDAPTEPITAPPSFYVYSPVQNENYASTQVLLNFTVIKPEAWFRATSSVPGYSYAVFGNVTSVYCTVDGGKRQNIPMHDLDDFYFNENPPRTLSFSTNMNLTGGVHSVVIGVEAVTYYVSDMFSSHPFSSVEVQAHFEPVNFSVEIPKPLIIVPENIAYNETSVPLVFTVDKSATWVGYSLDGKDNVTITGNTTLIGLHSGGHNVTVYAQIYNGNISVSQTVSFTIAKEPEPFPTTLVATASGASAMVIGVGLLVYLKKRKRQTE